MQPDRQDVQQLVTALFTVYGGLDRARREKAQARTLTVLQVIGAHPGVSPKAIAAELGLHPSSITRQVQVLEDAGQVVVVANQEDQRSCQITLTDAGQQALNQLTRIGFDRFALFVADWDAEDVRTLTRLLLKLEESTSAVARDEQQPRGRRWQQES
jgi:DNA-binding MarR family transcriptional regulator